MSLEAIEQQFRVIFEAIEAELAAKRTMPALMLLYSAVDIAGSLQRDEHEGTRKSFERWVSTYMLPHPGVTCQPVDLYAARCGILHTLTPDADLIRRGEAVKLVYASGTGDPTKLQDASDRLGHQQIAVHVATLANATIDGIRRFLERAAADPMVESRAVRAASNWFIYVDKAVVDRFLETPR